MTSHGTELLDRLLPPRPAGTPVGRWGRPPDARADARAWLLEHGLPGPKDEWWKYTDLASIQDPPWVPAARPPRAMPTRDAVDRVAGSYGGPRLVFVDGTFAPELSILDEAVDGVSCTSQTAVAGGRPGTEAPGLSARYDGFQALNDIAGHDGALVRVDGDTELDLPISVVHVSTGRDGLAFASHPRTTIELGADASATVIETYVALVGPHLANARTVIGVGQRARLTHYKVVHGRADAAHVAHTRIGLAADAAVRSWSVVAGAAVARSTIDASLRGRNADLSLEGLYLPVGTQQYDTAVTVEHATSDGSSRQQYRGVIGDAARGAFSGRVIVEADTTGNDANQVNRCLLLSPTAEADTRPWLEIFADDVRCAHGATVGRLDAEALFYLRTRGIPEADARRMLVEAFVGELVSTIEVPGLQAIVADLVARTADTGDRP